MDKELVKLAFRLGYSYGLEKNAGLGDWWRDTKAQVGGAIGQSLSRAGAGIQRRVNSAVDTITSPFRRAGAAIRGGFNAAVQGARQGYNAAAGAVRSGYNTAVDAAQQAGAAIGRGAETAKDVAGAVGDTAGAIGRKAYQRAIHTLQPQISRVGGYFNGQLQKRMADNV